MSTSAWRPSVMLWQLLRSALAAFLCRDSASTSAWWQLASLPVCRQSCADGSRFVVSPASTAVGCTSPSPISSHGIERCAVERQGWVLPLNQRESDWHQR
ncbi:MAG: hypothetical protein RLZZ216_858 [Cyanobacteriota bacterium]|jgi:hypothetical protein